MESGGRINHLSATVAPQKRQRPARGADLADAHEEVFETLDVDAHDLRNEIANLVLLK